MYMCWSCPWTMMIFEQPTYVGPFVVGQLQNSQKKWYQRVTCVLSKEMENKIPVVFQLRRKQAKDANFIQKATWVGEEWRRHTKIQSKRWVRLATTTPQPISRPQSYQVFMNWLLQHQIVSSFLVMYLWALELGQRVFYWLNVLHNFVCVCVCVFVP